MLGLASGLDLIIWSSICVLFEGNATDIMLTRDNDNYSSIISTFHPVASVFHITFSTRWCFEFWIELYRMFSKQILCKYCNTRSFLHTRNIFIYSLSVTTKKAYSPYKMAMETESAGVIPCITVMQLNWRVSICCRWCSITVLITRIPSVSFSCSNFALPCSEKAWCLTNKGRMESQCLMLN